MAASPPLFLYEEVMLLALKNESGRLATQYSELALAGAMLAELVLAGRVSLEAKRRSWLVQVADPRPLGDPLIAECQERLAAAPRRASLQAWVERLARLKHLRHRVAQRLCERGILRAEENRVLVVFRRKDYPEVDPAPERRILERLRAAIFSDEAKVEARTAALVSLAHAADLLKPAFGGREVRARRKRIEQIAQSEPAGKAVREVVAAYQAAVIAAVAAASS
jgi:golgi phosphoprotein 3